jgi:hypothetical protein
MDFEEATQWMPLMPVQQRAEKGGNHRPLSIRPHFCIPADQEVLLPKRRRAPVTLPAEAPLPRVGEVVYLSSTSAWTVSSIVHEWRSPHDLYIEIWLEYAGPARRARRPDFATTQ